MVKVGLNYPKYLNYASEIYLNWPNAVGLCKQIFHWRKPQSLPQSALSVP